MPTPKMTSIPSTILIQSFGVIDPSHGTAPGGMPGDTKLNAKIAPEVSRGNVSGVERG
jgi:hypothetical protein